MLRRELVVWLLLVTSLFFGRCEAFSVTSRTTLHTDANINEQVCYSRCCTELSVRRLFTSLSREGEEPSNSREEEEEIREDETITHNKDEYNDEQTEDRELSRRERVRQRMKTLAKNMVVGPISSAVPVPRAIAALLKDATVGAVDLAVEEVITRRSISSRDASVADLIDKAFAPVEESLMQVEHSLNEARSALEEAKLQATSAIEAVQAVAIAQAEGAAVAMAAAEEAASKRVMETMYNETTNSSQMDRDVSGLTYDEVGYHLSEMSPPFLDEDQCLVPGEAIVRVEKAPENSRRIFAGIDIPVSVDTVWQLLTDYEKLQEVVPNLVVNEVLEEFDGVPIEQAMVDRLLPDEQQCEQMSKQLKGALLKQVGGAKVAGINFSARTTLEVREWPQGIPDFARFRDEVVEGKAREERAKDYAKVRLQRYCFPRPFALSRLPTRDISMQSIANDDGEFRMYQGVWRMQPLPGCAPPGQDAMRLTYAVEVSPRAYLPVSLIEGRIVRDLCTNLVAIRDFVTSEVPVET